MEVTHCIAACIVFFGVFSTSISITIPRISLTIAAWDRKVEVTSKDMPYTKGDTILLTAKEPQLCSSKSSKWTCDSGNVKVLYNFAPSDSNSYHKSNVVYKYTNGKEFNKNSKCHSVWAIYIDSTGRTVASTCLMLHPTWINDLLPKIGNKRFRDLIIPGTHDSGAYKEGFKMVFKEFVLNKYIITQDDTILGQLYQGARYLDIRPAFYRISKNKWHVNHGIVKMNPLKEVMQQVVQFVKETGEPVIFGLKEFPVGFKDKKVHRDLVKFMVDYFGTYLIKPKTSNPWKTNLNELMVDRNARIILAYDDKDIVNEFSNVLFPAVRQNWGNVQKWKDLELYLRSVSLQDPLRLADNPVSDMAELTPKGSDIALNRLGGLRKMADAVNLNLCDLYENQLFLTSNIISVDFIKGTRIAESAIFLNSLISSI